MQQQKNKQAYFQGTDDKIAPHKMPPMIKSFSAIIKKYHGIDAAMNDQKAYEKKACKAHSDLFSYRRSEKMFPGHIQEL